ncbi:hypothetical protein Ocin01_09841 [Orchesella cincta]|uniref:Uncharacterized protein n=1 Tax=Orchesella cincta TaxID=48709 RepID=A0A1D2MUR5_ORCCI|nr:hypothetical protein Ocin01_09841 [Orchesella cincta]
MFLKSCSSFLLLICIIGSVLGGYDGVVDDEIWHRVLKVLSKGYGGSKIILSHPEPAYLVDSYTKIYPSYHHHHEPHYPQPHHHHHSHHHPHHHSHGGGYGVPAISSYGPPPAAHYHNNQLGYY